MPFRSAPSLFLVFASLVVWQFQPDALALAPYLYFLSIVVTTWHIFRVAKFPSLFTWVGLPYIGLFLLYPLVAPLLGLELNASDEDIARYCFLAIGGIHLLILGYESAAPPIARRQWNVRFKTSSNRLFTLLTLLLFLNIGAVLLVIVDAGTLSVIRSQSRVDMKESVGTLTTVAVLLFGFGTLLYPLAAVHMRQQRYRAMFWVPVIIFLELFLFLAFRVRTFPVIHGIALLVGWFLIAPRIEINARQTTRRKRLSLIQKGLLLGLAASLLLGMMVLRTFRGQFQDAESLADIQIDVVGSILFAFEGGGELGYSKWVFRVLEVVPEHYDYLYGQSYYRLLLTPIPRSIWPDKPLNSQRIIAQWIDPDAKSVQTTPVGIIGDLYVNFGMWGVLGMFVFGHFLGRLDRRNTVESMLLMAIAFAMMFHLARGAFTNPVLNLIVYYVIIRIAAGYLRGKTARTPPQKTAHASAPHPEFPDIERSRDLSGDTTQG